MHPSRVGPYLIERKIGAGGMGTVYYGRHAETGQEAAVKVLPASLAREEGFVARFTREIDALKQLANPHVVKLYESGRDGETYYYSMEYVNGETITNRLRRLKRMHWTETIEVAIQVCTALKAAHDAGIVHRDLKPSNLMMTADGMVKLTDFGIAQVFAATKLTVTGGIIGTAEYMSPEQAEGKRATKKSDLYSLGAVMYVMLTGRPPFGGKTTLEVIQKHKFGRFDRPSLIVPDVPRWLEEVVCQLLEKDPDKRFPDAFVLQRRLQEVLNKVALSAQEQTRVVAGYDGTGPTAALSGGAFSAAGAGPGAATIMRDLVRAELESQQAGSPLSNLLNNTWVLVALLVLIVVGGLYWFRNTERTPEEKLQAAKEILAEPQSSRWFDAREEYLEPLLDTDPQRWRKEVEPLLNQIQMYELQRSFRFNQHGRKRKPPANEAERFLRRAQQYQQMGETAEAERTLSALNTLLADYPEYETLRKLTRTLLDELRTNKIDKHERYALLRWVMERANRLAEASQPQEARKLWSSVIELYGSDPDPEAQNFVKLARERLKKVES